MLKVLDVARRRVFRFALVGLTVNDARLFSSLFGLLSNRMDHEWQPVAPELPHELTLLGAAATDQEVAEAHSRGAVLQFGANHADRSTKLCFPLRPTEMMFFLNGVGHTLERDLNTRTDLRTPTITGKTFPARNGIRIDDDGRVVKPAEDTAASTIASETLFKLTRWPDQRVLQESGNHLMLATLMVYRTTTLAELERRSGLQRAVCQEFVSNLLTSGHAVIADGAKPTKDNGARTPPTVVSRAAVGATSNTALKSGILAFIRRRLSI
jgi:hypothetical protein